MSQDRRAAPVVNSPAQVLFASLIGTTIEFFDFYIYATAAVLVFPKMFFPTSDPTTATLASLATFGIAFLARPIGSALFGHFGDRVGRKTTLVAALLTMGLSTVAIGTLPIRADRGRSRRCCWRSAVSVRALAWAVSGAALCCSPSRTRRRDAAPGTACFRSLGAPIGFFFSGGIFLLLSNWLTDEQFFAFGWRLPFLASAALVLVGLYVRLTITETPVFLVGARPPRACEGADGRRLPRLSGHAGDGCARLPRHVRAVLPDDGVRACRGARRLSGTAAKRFC